MKKLFLSAFILAVVIIGCSKTNEDTFVKDKITGVSQKGPFLNGSSLTAFELDEDFSQTGTLILR